MNESTGVDYVGPWLIGETIEGFGGVGAVAKSSNPEYSEGDLVCCQFGWPWSLYFVKKPDTSMQKVNIMYVVIIPLTSSNVRRKFIF
jgi:NADPH-dependent curcumin reductase CurA